MKLTDAIKDHKRDIELLRVATSYSNEYVRCGNQCDSSEGHERRKAAVLHAEAVFVRDNQKEILALAVKNLEAELDNARKFLTSQVDTPRESR